MLIYSAIASLDGYTADAEGRFDWAEPDLEVHAFVNDLERGIGTYLYGRRMYEVMLAWDTMPLEGQSPAVRDFAGIWRSADKIVYSTTLRTASSARTRIEPRFDPEAVRALKQHGDVSIGGPGLAASAIRAGLVDEYHLFVTPVVVGGGTSVFPDGVRARLDLVDQRRFASGVVYLRYRLRRLNLAGKMNLRRHAPAGARTMSKRALDQARPSRSRPSGAGVPAGWCSKFITRDSLTPNTASLPSSSSPRTKMCVTSVRLPSALTMKCRCEARMGERPVACRSLPTGPS
jgi:dihydrofolate reductase